MIVGNDYLCTIQILHHVVWDQFAAGVVAAVGVVGVVGVSPPPQDARVAASVTPATKVKTLRLIFFLDIIKILLRLYLLRFAKRSN